MADEPKITVDYSKVETRILGWVNDERDVHQATADELGIDRGRAKKINFAALYGVTWKGK